MTTATTPTDRIESWFYIGFRHGNNDDVYYGFANRHHAVRVALQDAESIERLNAAFVTGKEERTRGGFWQNEAWDVVKLEYQRKSTQSPVWRFVSAETGGVSDVVANSTERGLAPLEEARIPKSVNTAEFAMPAP